MYIPDNEGKACDAVVRLLEKLTGETRKSIRNPEEDGVGPPIDLRLRLGTCEYAIEHTRIEPYEKQIKTAVAFKQINDYITKRISDSLPGPAYYALHVPIIVCLPETRKKRERVLNNLAKWIRTSAHCLQERDLGRSGPTRNPVWSDDCIKGTPQGFGCDIELLRWPDATLIRRKPGSLAIMFIPPDVDELEDLRIDRLRRAFFDKCPKLARCREDGARTVLVLESLDNALTRFDQIGSHLPALLAEQVDVPDEIYLVETGRNLWWTWPMKRDDDHWPTVGMPGKNQCIYEADKLPTVGLPKWYREALGLDELYKPHPVGWIPATCDRNELDDMTSGRV